VSARRGPADRADMKDARDTDTETPPPARARGQRGYALVALLALMTVMMIAAMAAAPNVRHQSRRDLEAEAIARGEEVAEAIRAFYHMSQPNRLPTSMEELEEGVPYGTKKIRVLRASAARDPLSKSGEWKPIRVQDREFIGFVRSLMLYSNGLPAQRMIRDARMLAAAQGLPQLTNVLDLGHEEEAPGGEDTSTPSKGPFIGVVSRSQRKSVISYYGIERHDKWVFTPLFR
jgi:type II secretory pathway pseudopilin PulG